MAAELFNSLGGFSAGIPAVEVVDSNGNVVTNVLTTGNVAANNVYATHYYWANGQPFSGGGSGNGVPGGNTGELQFNNAGNFGASPALTFSTTNNILTTANLSVTNSTELTNVAVTGSANLGPVGNITITGGTAGYVLSTDGNGILSWVAQTGGNGGNGNPGGANTFVQFNDDGTFGGNSSFTYDKDSQILTVPIIYTGDISADIVGANAFQTSGNVTAANITVSDRANITGNLRAVGNITFASSPNIFLGNVANIHITGGTNGYVLTTDGLGNLSWAAGGGGGGNGTPGGANTQVQFNFNGDFGGDTNFTFNPNTDTVTIGGNLIANSMQIGSGVYKFCTSEVYFASTASMAVNQVLYSIPVEDISGVEFHIIATDSISGTRQSAKISSIYYAGVVQFNEYAGLQINGGVGNFSVDYDPGDIVNPPSLELKVSPDSSNLIVYRILITVYAS